MVNAVQQLEQYICTLYDTRDQLKNHVFSRADRAFALGDEARDAILTREQLIERQLLMRQAFLEAIGGLPQSNSPLNAQTVKVVHGDGYVVENVIFESRPKHYVTANLYIPEKREEPTAAVLFLCGHEREGKHSLYYHKVCLRFVQAGLIVLAVDPIGQGERLSFSEPIWGTREHQRLGVQCYALGESVARYFVHDAIRAIDFLQTRPEVDPARLGVTGNSGGGTQTAMLMLADERVAAAAPATFIMNRQQYMHAGGVQDAEQVWPGLSALGFDHEDILLCFAPKPLLVLAVQYDFFPIEATRRTVARCRRFWKMLHEPYAIELVEDISTHRYTDRLAQAAAHFFSSVLLGRDYDPGPVDLEPLDPTDLVCTTSGQVSTTFRDARTAADESRERSRALQYLRNALPPDQRKKLTRAWLHEKVILPREKCELNPRRVSLDKVQGLSVDYLMWWSQPGIMNSAYLFGSTPASLEEIVVGLWPGGTTVLEEHWPWIAKECAQGRSVFVLNCSGMGPHEPYPIYGKPSHNFFGVIHKLTDDLLWLGDSLAALRTYDVLRSLEMLSSLTGDSEGSCKIFAVGQYQLYAVLASVLEERIKCKNQEAGPFSLADFLFDQFSGDANVMDVVFPGILQYLDLDEWKGEFSK